MAPVQQPLPAKQQPLPVQQQPLSTTLSKATELATKGFQRLKDAATATSKPTDPSSKKPGFFESVLEILSIPVDKAVVQVAPEIGHIAPVIFTVGSLFMATVTMNIAYFFLALTSLEALAIQSVIAKVASYASTAASSTAPEPADTSKCSSYFTSITPPRFKSLINHGIKNTFPNSPLYFISFAAAYVIQSLFFFSQECSELGPSYSNRPYLAIVGAAMFVLLYALYLLSYGCDSVLVLVGSIVVGLLIGALLCHQNLVLLGKSSVNLLFIPELSRRTGMDYICVTTNAPTSS
jgi:hypothetical protein